MNIYVHVDMSHSTILPGIGNVNASRETRSLGVVIYGQFARCVVWL
jgi:hypothetical protein